MIIVVIWKSVKPFQEDVQRCKMQYNTEGELRFISIQPGSCSFLKNLFRKTPNVRLLASLGMAQKKPQFPRKIYNFPEKATIRQQSQVKVTQEGEKPFRKAPEPNFNISPLHCTKYM